MVLKSECLLVYFQVKNPRKFKQRKCRHLFATAFYSHLLLIFPLNRLLTLTSYPFRVVYSNQAFSRLTGRTASVIGDSVFDIVQMERSLFCAPSMPTFPTLQDRLENHDVALVQALVASDEHHNQNFLHQWIKCRVHVQHVVTNANDGIEMGYLAVRFTPQHYIQRS